MAVASLLLGLGITYSCYAATVFDEPKVSFSGDSGMSSPDKQYIDKKLKDLENLINSRMNAMENRVNTAIANSKGVFTDPISVSYRSGWINKINCPAGYIPIFNETSYYEIYTCFKGYNHYIDRSPEHEGGNHD